MKGNDCFVRPRPRGRRPCGARVCTPQPASSPISIASATASSRPASRYGCGSCRCHRLRRHVRQLDQLVGVRVGARHVDQAGRQADRARAHALIDQVRMPASWLVGGSAGIPTDDVEADDALRHVGGDVGAGCASSTAAKYSAVVDHGMSGRRESARSRTCSTGGNASLAGATPAPQLPTTSVVTPCMILKSTRGSRMTAASSCACTSMNPGATARPRASISCAARAPHRRRRRCGRR